MEKVFVDPLSIILMFITLILSIGFPLFLWIMFARKKVGISIAVIAGALGFFVPQIIIRIPIIQILSLLPGWIDFNQNNVFLSVFLFAITAALFETTGRLIVFRTLLKDRISYNAAVGAGIGHGGIESIFLIGLTYINNIIFSFLINTNLLPEFEGVEETVRALTGTAPEMFFLAGVERVFTIFFHIAISTILCYFILKGKTIQGVLVCILVHFTLDFILPIMNINGVSIWIIEGFLLIVAIVSIILLRYMKLKYPITEISKDPAEIALEEGY